MNAIPESWAKQMQRDIDLDKADPDTILARIHTRCTNHTTGQAKIALEHVATPQSTEYDYEQYNNQYWEYWYPEEWLTHEETVKLVDRCAA